jgi:HTH-type transcriptional regulator/antitoxin HigA
MSGLTKFDFVTVPDDYLELIQEFPLRALHQPREHAEALRVMTRLPGRPGGRLSAGERDYVQVSGHLIDEYGQRKQPFLRRKHTPLEMLKFLMRENGMSTTDLGNVLGNKTAASLVINGKRELSKSHIRKLSARFRVDPGLFF